MDPTFVTLREMAVNIDIDVTIFIQLGIVLLLMLLLKQLIFKPYLQSVDEREKKTQLTRDEAGRLREQADSLVAHYEAAVTKGRDEALAVRKELRLTGIQAKDGTLDAARKEAATTVAKAQDEVAAQSEAAQGELAAQASVLSKVVVEKVLGRAL
jgi:F-type H+-transporting ATPase subunit b